MEWNNSFRKRKPSPESSGHDSSPLLRQLESKDQELEARMNSICTEFKTMQSVNEDLKSQVQHLQQQCDRLLLHNRELESRISRLEQCSHDVEPRNLPVDQLVKDFAERCDLVESNNQGLVERLDSCQQNVSKIRQRNENFENQLTSLQQQLNIFGIHDKNIHHNETVPTQQLAAKSTVIESTLEPVHESNDGCTLIEETLCRHYEKQIPLLTDEIQYGIFDVCDKHNVILIKEKDKLKLFDHRRQIDERPYGELGHSNFATCIHWCAFLDSFLVLYRFKLYTLSLKRKEETSQMEFDRFTHINSIRVYSLNHHPTHLSHKGSELLRFVTTSPNLPGFLFLNRHYRRIELVNMNSWKVQRGWSKQDLDYEEAHDIRLITFSSDGSYLVMDISWNSRMRFIDLRKNDDQLTLLKSIRMENGSVPLRHRVQVPFEDETWLVVGEKNQCYKISANPEDQRILPIRTEHVQAIENVPIELRFIGPCDYLLVGAVVGDCKHKQGVFNFYKFP